MSCPFRKAWHVGEICGVSQGWGQLKEEEELVITGSPVQGFEAAQDVEALMERMRQLQESLLQDEGASQEEMESRFELEKSESLLVTPSGT